MRRGRKRVTRWFMSVRLVGSSHGCSSYPLVLLPVALAAHGCASQLCHVLANGRAQAEETIWDHPLARFPAEWFCQSLCPGSNLGNQSIVASRYRFHVPLLYPCTAGCTRRTGMIKVQSHTTVRSATDCLFFREGKLGTALNGNALNNRYIAEKEYEALADHHHSGDVQNFRWRSTFDVRSPESSGLSLSYRLAGAKVP